MIFKSNGTVLSSSLSFTHNGSPNWPLWDKEQDKYKILARLKCHHFNKQAVILTCSVHSLQWFWRSRGIWCGLRSLSPLHCSLSPLSGSALWPQLEVPLCQSMLDLSQHRSVCLKLKLKCHTHNLIKCSQSHQIHCLTLWCQNFLLNFSTPVFKMWVIQAPNRVALWNQWHFEERKTEIMQHV
jgi:hypothetical protein